MDRDFDEPEPADCLNSTRETKEKPCPDAFLPVQFPVSWEYMRTVNSARYLFADFQKLDFKMFCIYETFFC